jgi:subtilisin family serine protease
MQWIADPDGDPSTKDAPRLVSNSWGGGAPSPGDDPSKDVLCTAVDAWVKVGMLPVFANGNSGPSKSSVGVPGACPSALGIGATDKNDDITSFSSRGPAVWKTGTIVKPNASAPGKDVISSVPGGKYRALSGTSMATPHAAGLATLLFQADPNLTAEQVASIMMKSAKDLGPSGMDNDSGAGRIDALHALSPALR